MSKMQYSSNKFSKIVKCRGPLTFDFGDLKLRDLTKLCYRTDLWRNRIKKISYDVIL